jgi:hypothetical protein
MDMDCRDCHRWNKDETRCLDGKVNPHRYETAVNVAQVLGIRSICPFNDFRERLIASRSHGRSLANRNRT